MVTPVRAPSGSLAWTVLLFVAIVSVGGPEIISRSDDVAVFACIRDTTAGQCKARRGGLGLDAIVGAYAGKATLTDNATARLAGLSLLSPRALSGAEESVLLVRGSDSDATVLLGAMVGDGAVRVGTETYALPSEPWRVYPLDIAWSEIKKLPEVSTRLGELGVLAFLLGAPVLAALLAGRWIVRPLRRHVLSYLTYEALAASRGALAVICGFLLTVTFTFGLFHVMEAWLWVSSRWPGSKPQPWDSLLSVQFATLLMFQFVALTLHDILSLAIWVDEVEDLSVLLDRSSLVSSDRNTDDTFLPASGATDTRFASLEDRELLRILDAWPVEKPGIGVLLALGIEPPPVPWTQLDSDDVLAQPFEQWRAHLGLTPVYRHVASEEKKSEQELAREAKEAAIRLRFDTARYQRVQALQRVLTLQYARAQPNRIVLLPLGRTILAMPPMALVDDIPFSVQRKLAEAEDELGQGHAVQAIQKNAVFLEDYLKQLLSELGPRSLEHPAWKQAGFWRRWLELLERGELGKQQQRVFLDTLHQLVRRCLVGSPARALPHDIQEVVSAGGGAVPMDVVGVVLDALRIRVEDKSESLVTYLKSLGVDAKTAEDGQIRGAILGRLRTLDRPAAEAHFRDWTDQLDAMLAQLTLGSLLVGAKALLPVLMDKDEALQQHLGLLDAHVTVIDCSGERIRELRNATMHDRSHREHSDARSIRMAEHMLWLTRIFVTTVEGLRRGASASRTSRPT